MSKVLLFLTALFCASGISKAAASYDLSGASVAGGSATAAGGRFGMSATIGEATAGVSTSTNYMVVAGFWGEATLLPIRGVPGLSLTRSGPNIILYWPASQSNLVPQSTTELSAHTVWTPVTQPVTLVGDHYQVIIPATKPKEFFRVIRP